MMCLAVFVYLQENKSAVGDESMANQSERVGKLMNRLLTLGYHQQQIMHIVRDTVEEADLSHLSETQVQLVMASLQEYIDFAVKCKKKL